MLGTISYVKEPTREFPGGDMPSHTLPKYLSMIRYNSKITQRLQKLPLTSLQRPYTLEKFKQKQKSITNVINNMIQ